MYIGRQPQSGNFQVCDTIAVVNDQAAYTMQVSSVDVIPETANHMLVSLNGILQAPTSSYTVSGSTITFASNLVTGDVIDFIQILGSVLDLGVPSDATVSTAKIVDGAVTYAKASGFGKVGQMISTQLDVERTTTSTSYADITGVAVTITPSATSSKVWIQGSILWGRSTNNTMWLKMLRGATVINGQSFSSADTGTFWGSGVDSGYYELRSAPFSFLDSPNTTSAVTYKIQWRTDGNTLYMNRIGADTNQAGTSQINAIEILG